MISFLTYRNLHEYGAAFSSQFCLRHRSFKERQDYNVSSYEGMEYDQYDTPATIYLVYQSPLTGEALGLSRLTPVSQSCMIKDHWPQLVNDHDIFKSNSIWESTRFCVEKSLPFEQRRRISHELVLAHLELGLSKGMTSIIGVMPTFILLSVFAKAGCHFTKLGPQIRVDGLRIQAAIMDVSEEQLVRVRRKTQISESVLKFQGEFNENFRRTA